MSEKIDPKLLEKIRKLMALSESPNEAEAANALSKAKVLLAKYGLSVTDLHKGEETVMQKVLLRRKRLRSWQSHLITVILSVTYCEALRMTDGEGGRIMLVGREENILAAENLYEYLSGTISRMGREFRDTVRHVDSFRLGMVDRIAERLKEMNRAEEMPQEEKQLVVRMDETAARENREYIKKHYGRVRRKKTRSSYDPHSFGLGKAVGGKVSLGKQIQ